MLLDGIGFPMDVEITLGTHCLLSDPSRGCESDLSSVRMTVSYGWYLASSESTGSPTEAPTSAPTRRPTLYLAPVPAPGDDEILPGSPAEEPAPEELAPPPAPGGDTTVGHPTQAPVRSVDQ